MQQTLFGTGCCAFIRQARTLRLVLSGHHRGSGHVAMSRANDPRFIDGNTIHVGNFSCEL
jgi:hypothetical protein